MGTGRVRMVVATVALAGLVGCQDGGGGRAARSPGGEVTVRALNVPDDLSIAVLMYLPQSITVTQGSTVAWALTGPEPHSVTFFPVGEGVPPLGSDRSLFAPTPAPDGAHDPRRLVNSGLVPRGPPPVAPFKLRFDAVGTYTYHCVLHPQMIGTVRVTTGGSEADTPARVNERGERELRQWAAEGREAKRRLTSGPPASSPNPDGSLTWTVAMGASTAHTEVLAFAPVTADLRPGDAVAFVNDSYAPHTATFPGERPPPEDPSSPEAAVPLPGPSPQPLPSGGEPAGTGTVPAASPAGSGLPLAARSFTFVVPQSGEFPYVCVYHRSSGMAGLIRVA
ncbi:MAG: hypothetical protein ACLGI2_02865 [Acidimicrobiia bacterium]